MEYVQRYFRQAHIVGIKQYVDSDTLNKSITSITFIDLEKAETTTQLEARRGATGRKLGALASRLEDMPAATAESDPATAEFLRQLSDAHVQPASLMAAARGIKGFETVFDEDAGNWEGFTLGEHTETVLRNFDENFADDLPVSVLAPMRLAIVAHDLGKPKAAASGEKHRQKDYNVVEAAKFFESVGVSEGMSQLLLGMIGDGEDLAFDMHVSGSGEAAKNAMKQLATTSLRKFNGGADVTLGQMRAFSEMCKMLLVCDGGAYTSMAVTRRPGKGAFRNAPSYNNTFAEPTGFGKRGIKIRRPDEKPASNDLTPETATPVSRVKVSRGGVAHKFPVA